MMVFNSFAFVGFWIVMLAMTMAGNLVAASKGGNSGNSIILGNVRGVALRNILLLVGSYCFYATFNAGFLGILIYVTLVNYIGGILMARKEAKRKVAVGVCVVLSLIPLIFYKYTAFFLTHVFGVPTSDLGLFSRIALPVGISFYTFQALSYTIDLYRNKISEERNFVDFALFVAFFPTLLSGPIEKARNLLPQIKHIERITGECVGQGLVIFLWGLFKKVVIADRLAEYVNLAYYNVEYSTGATLALAAVFYSIQIYCDFSGYSDMAWGVAKSLGFNITRNFNFPYTAISFKDFWRRWHIALTTWFTEYVYFSLGGNRVKHKARWMLNISMVFILSGIWHGAAWNFLTWGCLHAGYYLIEHFLGFQKKGFSWPVWMRPVAWIIVFGLVTIAWIFFRIPSSPQLPSYCYLLFLPTFPLHSIPK